MTELELDVIVSVEEEDCEELELDVIVSVEEEDCEEPDIAGVATQEARMMLAKERTIALFGFIGYFLWRFL